MGRRKTYRVGTREYNEMIEVCRKEYSSNNRISSFDGAFNVNKSDRYNFICSKCELEYDTVMIWRLTRGGGCPYCAGKRVAKGVNDLGSRFPNIASEWNPSKNGELKADSVTYGSDRKVWWMCEQGHEWETVINYRTSGGNGCPLCNNNQTSYPEQLVYRVMQEKFPKTVNRLKVDGMEFDIVVPELKLFIEYDGAHWHGGRYKKKHMEEIKEIAVLGHGYHFLRIAEVSDSGIGVTVEKLTDNNYLMVTPELRRGKNRSKKLCDELNIYLKNQFGIELKLRLTEKMYDYCVVDSKTMIKDNNITITHPHLMEEWDESNTVSPLTLTKGSEFRVKWKCKLCKHKWSAIVGNRARLGSGCPICARKTRGITRSRNAKIR